MGNAIKKNKKIMVQEKNLISNNTSATNTDVTITKSIQPIVDYSGSVIIEYTDRESGNQKTLYVHNSGADGLFTAITRALAGLTYSAYLPASIMAFSDTGNEVFTQRIHFSATPILFKDDTQSRGENNNIIQYTFIIPINNIIRQGSATKINSIILYNNSLDPDTEKCAEVKLANSVEVSTSNIASNLLIYWKLKFINAQYVE